MARYKHLKEKFHLNDADAKRIDGQIVSYIRTETFRNRSEEKRNIRSFIEADLKNFEIDAENTDEIENIVQKYIDDMDLNLFQESMMGVLLYALSLLQMIDVLFGKYVFGAVSTVVSSVLPRADLTSGFWKELLGVIPYFIVFVVWKLMVNKFLNSSHRKSVEYFNRHLSILYAILLLLFYSMGIIVQSIYSGYNIDCVVLIVRIVLVLAAVIYPIYLVSYWSEKDDDALQIDKMMRNSRKTKNEKDQNEGFEEDGNPKELIEKGRVQKNVEVRFIINIYDSNSVDGNGS